MRDHCPRRHRLGRLTPQGLRRERRDDGLTRDRAPLDPGEHRAHLAGRKAATGASNNGFTRRPRVPRTGAMAAPPPLKLTPANSRHAARARGRLVVALRVKRPGPPHRAKPPDLSQKLLLGEHPGRLRGEHPQQLVLLVRPGSDGWSRLAKGKRCGLAIGEADATSSSLTRSGRSTLASPFGRKAVASLAGSLERVPELLAVAV